MSVILLSVRARAYPGAGDRGRIALSPPSFFGPRAMQLTAVELIVNPCDDEEDNMALLCCMGLAGESLLITRFPDEDEVGLALDIEDEPYLLRDLKITLSVERLLIEVAPGDREALRGSEVLEVLHATDPADLPEVLETLANILRGTGVLVNQVV